MPSPALNLGHVSIANSKKCLPGTGPTTMDDFPMRELKIVPKCMEDHEFSLNLRVKLPQMFSFHACPISGEFNDPQFN